MFNRRYIFTLTLLAFLMSSMSYAQNIVNLNSVVGCHSLQNNSNVQGHHQTNTASQNENDCHDAQAVQGDQSSQCEQAKHDMQGKHCFCDMGFVTLINVYPLSFSEPTKPILNTAIIKDSNSLILPIFSKPPIQSA